MNLVEDSMIKKLSLETINLISAGEVIECPADVIKELIENSIDAGAKTISIKIKSSGIDLIEIKDDGCGISKDDLNLCLEKYATSKLEDISDLETIQSFGFRGEALSSINAVSKLKIVSSITNDGKGYILENNDVKETPSNKGTTIEIKDLFYNLPVRKKFLKSPSTEFSKLYFTFLNFVLANPNIKFVFESDKKNNVFARTDSTNRYLQVFGIELKDKMLNIDISTDLFKVKGIVAKPTDYFYYPSNFLFINNRSVYSTQINKIVKDAYKDYLMVQQKPFFVLFFEFNPKTIDVNVHPKKKIVKLQNEMLCLNEFKEKLIEILEANNIKQNENLVNSTYKINDFGNIKFSSNNKFSFTPSPIKLNTPKYNSNNNVNYSVKQNLIVPNNKIEEAVEELVLANRKITKVLGQIKDTYIVCETTEGFLMVDQHAAAERINLEKNRVEINPNLDKQSLINSIEIDFITESQKEFLLNNKNTFSQLGFDYILENDNLYVTSLPVFLNKLFDKQLFLNLINKVETNPKETVDKLKDNLIKLKTCKNSIKANEPLTLPQQINLIKDLESCKDKTICAHGRPTILFYKTNEIEKLFKRIV